jgi:hypothetical protein
VFIITTGLRQRRVRPLTSMKKNFRNSWLLTWALMLALQTVAIAQIKSEPGTVSRTAKPGIHGAISGTSITPFTTETGLISLSSDALGTNDPAGGIIQVQKPAGATVRKAYLLAATVPNNYNITNSDITLDGQAVTFTSTVANTSISGIVNNYLGDVTALVKAKIDAAPAGLVNFTAAEGVNTNSIDGVILAVILNDPTQTRSNTIVLLFGAQNTSGDTFNLGLANPIDKTAQGFALNMSLGISFSFQGCTQFSTVDVNGQRLTSSAGGQDDGEASNGALITAGGVGDSPTNPADPNGSPCANTAPFYDDELYDLAPFVQNGDKTIKIDTVNPSSDDNIFFAAIFVGANQAIVGEGILLSPSSATNPVGTQHTVTATLQNSQGTAVVGRAVAFSVTAGPNAGATGTCSPVNCATDSTGKVSFTYTGSAGPGTDEIQACFANSQNQNVCSQTVTKTWEGGGGGGGPTPGPVSKYYLTAGEQGITAITQFNNVIGTFFEHFPQSPGQYAISVLNTVRIMGSFLDGIISIGSEYTLSGTYTGVNFPFPLAGAGFWDGATDGTNNYSIDYNNGGVYKFDSDWGGPTLLFATPIHYLGITYDESNNTLWLSQWDTGVVEHRSLDGTLLGSFNVPFINVSCLALDAADGTLWMGSQTTQGTFYQYTQAGALVTTRFYPFLTKLNTLGGEFPSTIVAPTPRPAPGPTPTVTLSVSPSQISEGDDATFTVSRSAVSAQPLVVGFSMSGKATQGSDYTLSGPLGAITIAGGASSATVVLHAIADHVSEKKETATMTLTSSPGYNLAKPKKATAKILDAP